MESRMRMVGVMRNKYRLRQEMRERARRRREERMSSEETAVDQDVAVTQQRSSGDGTVDGEDLGTLYNDYRAGRGGSAVAALRLLGR